MKTKVTAPNGRALRAPKPVQLGRKWLLSADFGEARGLHDGLVHGYAIRQPDAYVFEFIIYHPADRRRAHVAQLFAGWGGGRAPMYVRQAVGWMMRALNHRAGITA